MESTESTLPPVSNTFAPTPRRSLLRRSAPWAASVMLFAGGSLGVYQYAAPQSETEATAADSMLGASAARQSVEQLFSTNSSEATASTPAASPQADAAKSVDRYASAPADDLASPPQLPPTSDESEAPEVQPVAAAPDVQNPFAPTPAPPADPYEQPPVDQEAAAAIEQDELLAGEMDMESSAELRDAHSIARGQGPDYNPLRSNEGSEPFEPQQARSAFADAAAQSSADGNAAPPEPAAVEQPLPYGNSNAIANSSSTPTPGADPYGPPDVAAAPYEPQVADEPQSNLDVRAEPLPLEQAPREASPSYGQLVEEGGGGRTPIANPYAGGPASQDDFGAAGVTPTPGITSSEGTGRPGEKILEGTQSPAIAIQKLAPAEIQVGKKCTFAIRVQNHGQRAAQGVRILDEVPLGTTLIGTAPRATVAGSQVEWDLGDLSVGEERIVEMELLPTAEGEIGSVATVKFAAQASAKTRCTKPELALRLTSQPTVMIGQRQVIQIEVTNPGSGDATNVVLLESIPEGVAHPAGPSLEYPIGTLRAGESRRIDLQLNAVHAGQVNNVMTARADANLQVQANCQFEVLAPDLRVSVNGPKRRYLERPAKYTVTINNPGTASARDVQLVTQLPHGLQFVSADNYGEYDQATHSVHWSLEELPAGKDGAVELVALPVESGEHKLQVATKAQQGLQDSTEQSVTVDGLAALSFEVVDLQDPIEVGGETTYEIRVVNQGSKSAANVQITAAFPRGMRALSAQGETQFRLHGESVQFAPLSRLAPKAEATFRVAAQGTMPGDQRVRVTVEADDFDQPITKEASTRVYADE